jgi:hypothetical protein
MPQTRVNVLTHWWDGSQVYGVRRLTSRPGAAASMARCVLDDGHLPMPSDPPEDPYAKPGFWVGFVMLRTVLPEHNAICDRLGATYPSWDDEEIFQRRLVNSALIAKIHTIEWTPAVISHPTTVAALRANAGSASPAARPRLFGRLSKARS